MRAAASVRPDQYRRRVAFGSCASASRVAAMWSAAVFDPALPGLSTTASGSPDPSLP
jgi:hypothetical protein